MAVGEPAHRAPMTMTSYMALPSHCLLGFDVRRDRRHRRIAEQLVDRHLDAQFHQERALNADHDHGLAAQGEEVVVRAHVVASELSAPDRVHDFGNHHSPLFRYRVVLIWSWLSSAALSTFPCGLNGSCAI